MPSAGRIERLEILNFKSFKCHQIVGPFRDLAAISRGNGAGRADLEDAITFVLGVRSFSFGRIAFVKLVFCTAGGEEIKFGRAITNSGTSEYRINNIPVTWEIYSNTIKSLGIGEETPPPPPELEKIHPKLEVQKAPKSTKQETTDLSKEAETMASLGRSSTEEHEAAAIDKWKTTTQPSFRSLAAPLSLLGEGEPNEDGAKVTRRKIKDVVGMEKGAGSKKHVSRSLPRIQTLAQEGSLQRSRSLSNTRTNPDAATPLQWFEVEDEDDDWSDIDPEKDSLGKAEDLADKLLRDAKALHARLAAEGDMAAVSRFCSKAQHLMAETKETCGAIMYASQDLESESRPLSFSSQCSDAAEERELLVLRGRNARRQTKIDSLQEWRAYYKSELEARLAKLADLERHHAKELQRSEKTLRKLANAHGKELARRDARREAMEARLREQIRELHLVVEELSGQLYDMEEHLAAKGIPYKPPSANDPSSKTLLSAVISVKEAAHTFSRTFMSHLKQHLAKARDLDEQICLESEVLVARPSDYKFLVQSFICRRMFLDFDSECFNIESAMTELFDAEAHARACFQEYLTHRDTSPLLTTSHSAFLREFCFRKFLHIVSESTEEAFFGDFHHSDEICAGRDPGGAFYESFCRLAVAVWLLHRLAFSFQPPARMIPVRKGARFDPVYMESAVPGIVEGDGGAALPFEALVGLMVHPGFRVGNSVIPAQVYLVTT